MAETIQVTEAKFKSMLKLHNRKYSAPFSESKSSKNKWERMTLHPRSPKHKHSWICEEVMGVPSLKCHLDRQVSFGHMGVE
jgi:hypothetical protein